MTIGQRVKIRREELGMSQEELAKKIGYKSKSSINKIELGFRVLTQSKIKAIADALDTTPSYIMGWDEEASRNEWASKFRDSVMQILNNADPADLEAAGISVQEIEEELSGSDSISLGVWPSRESSDSPSSSAMAQAVAGFSAGPYSQGNDKGRPPAGGRPNG